MTSSQTNRTLEFALLGLLALLWGSSYLFIKVAVVEIPPLTLIACRVAGAALFLGLVLMLRRESLPRDGRTWGMLLIQSFFNSIAAWTLLAWGQQHIDASLATVLNSTSPIFVFLITLVLTRHEGLSGLKLTGAILGLAGVCLVVGLDALEGIGTAVWGQLACLLGAALYGWAAIYGRRFSHITPTATAAGTLIWATIFLVPAALLFEDPLSLRPSQTAIAATVTLSLACTGIAMMIYFRLVRTLGSLGTASQAYLRAGVGVLLGIVLLGETMTLGVALGLTAAVAGVAMINWPRRAASP